MLKGHSSQVQAIAVLSDGHIATGSGKNIIRLWNTTTMKCDLRIDAHAGCVESLVQLSDGRLVSGSDDMTIKVWGKKR